MEITLEDKQWLIKAEEYAKSRGINYLDFSDVDFWLDYKYNYNLSPEEAVDDEITEQD